MTTHTHFFTKIKLPYLSLETSSAADFYAKRYIGLITQHALRWYYDRHGGGNEQGLPQYIVCYCN